MEKFFQSLTQAYFTTVKTSIPKLINTKTCLSTLWNSQMLKSTPLFPSVFKSFRAQSKTACLPKIFISTSKSHFLLSSHCMILGQFQIFSEYTVPATTDYQDVTRSKEVSLKTTEEMWQTLCKEWQKILKMVFGG